MKKIDLKQFSKFLVIGKLVNGKKFKLVYPDYYTADCINLYNGNIWGVRKDGTKKLLKSVIN
ncbi:MAG: hypothetical protein JSV62_12835 [Promethearchaeota archaeon]|nr:MAG: hypothetical protein JSV62_12835 [Candidatus Lokiarchaeota archaeon]